MPARQPSNQDLLDAIHAHSLNGEVKELRALLPDLRVVSSLAPSVPPLQRLAAHVETLVTDAVEREERATTFRTLRRWLSRPINLARTVMTLAAMAVTVAYYLFVMHHPNGGL
jgi:hypothetical protein